MGIHKAKIREVKQVVKELGKWDTVKIMEITGLPYHEVKQIKKKLENGEGSNGQEIKA